MPSIVNTTLYYYGEQASNYHVWLTFGA